MTVQPMLSEQMARMANGAWLNHHIATGNLVTERIVRDTFRRIRQHLAPPHWNQPGSLSQLDKA